MTEPETENANGEGNDIQTATDDAPAPHGDNTSDEPQEAADKYDGVTARTEGIQATVRMQVEISDAEIEELPERMDPSELAEWVAESRVEDKMFGDDVTMTRTIAEEDNLSIDDGKRFKVWVEV